MLLSFGGSWIGVMIQFKGTRFHSLSYEVDTMYLNLLQRKLRTTLVRYKICIGKENRLLNNVKDQLSHPPSYVGQRIA